MTMDCLSDMEKECFKCKVIQPLTEYYPHKEMSGGTLNKCKTCTKNDTKARINYLKETNPVWVANEKKRGREKFYRLGYGGKYKPTKEGKISIMKRYTSKYPEKKAARIAKGKMKPVVYGNELHHWSYNIEHYKDLIELSIKDHNKLHRYMIYDQSFKMYRRADNNELLNTKEKHINYFNEIKNLE